MNESFGLTRETKVLCFMCIPQNELIRTKLSLRNYLGLRFHSRQIIYSHTAHARLLLCSNK